MVCPLVWVVEKRFALRPTCTLAHSTFVLVRAPVAWIFTSLRKESQTAKKSAVAGNNMAAEMSESYHVYSDLQLVCKTNKQTSYEIPEIMVNRRYKSKFKFKWISYEVCKLNYVKHLHARVTWEFAWRRFARRSASFTRTMAAPTIIDTLFNTVIVICVLVGYNKIYLTVIFYKVKVNSFLQRK